MSEDAPATATDISGAPTPADPVAPTSPAATPAATPATPAAVEIPDFVVNSDETFTLGKDWKNSKAVHPSVRGSELFDRAPSMHALTKAYHDTMKWQGRDKEGFAIIPGENSTEDEQKEFWQGKMGVPESPEGYEWENNLPEGVEADEATQQWFKQTAHAANLTPTQAKAVAEAFNDHFSASVLEAQAAQATAAQEKIDAVADWVTQHPTLGKNRVGETLKFAQNALNEGMSLVEEAGFQKDSPEVVEAVTLIRSNPALYAMFSKFGRAYQEHGIAGVGTEYVQTPDGLTSQISGLEKQMAALKASDNMAHLKPEYKGLASQRSELIRKRSDAKAQ